MRYTRLKVARSSLRNEPCLRFRWHISMWSIRFRFSLQSYLSSASTRHSSSRSHSSWRHWTNHHMWTLNMDSFLCRRQQLRNLMSYVSCRRSPCPLWKYPNTSRWSSSWERDPTERSCWPFTESEVSAWLKVKGRDSLLYLNSNSLTVLEMSSHTS